VRLHDKDFRRSHQRERECPQCCGAKCTNTTTRFYHRLLTVLGTMELLHCAILLAVIIQAQCEVSVSGLESVEVREGEEARLTCSTSSADIVFCQFEDPSGKSFIMKENLPYEGGRLTYHGEDPTKDCGIRIANVRESDNGKWTCTLTVLVAGQGVGVKDEASVIVSRPPADIHLEVEGQVKTSEIIKFSESKSRKVSCVTTGARPAVKFSWMLGEEPYKGKVMDLPEEVNQDGSMRQVQQVDYEAEPSHNGKKLVCIVAHSGFSQEDISQQRNSAGLLLDVQFQPVAADHPQTFYNLKTGESKEVLMSFRAHPRPTEVLWQLGDNLEVLEGSESDDKNFRAEVLQDGPNDGMFTAKLFINDVTEKIAGSAMNLVVANELGRTFYPFKLSLGEKPAAAPAVSGSDGSVTSSGAGTGPVIAIVVVAIIIIVVIVVTVIARSQGMLCFADPPKTDDEKEKTVEKEEGSETESAKGEDSKEAKDEASVEDGELRNNNTKKSVTERMTSLLSAVKKSVGGRREKYSEGGESELQDNEGKENGIETDERKDDSIVYADLDKSAMSGGSSVAVENEKTTYAEIKPGTKE